jgi:phenylacetate-CoA ligase
MKPNVREAAFFALFALRGQAVGKYYRHMLREDCDGIPPNTAATRLRDLLSHCERQVPYYAELMRETGGRYLEDPEGYLTRLPVLTKDIIRARFDDLKSRDLSRRKWKFNTSGGSTGEPVRLIQDWEFAARSGAVQALNYKLVGRETGEPEIKFWGSVRDNVRATKALRARLLLRLSNTMNLNCYDMTPADMYRYIAAFNRVRPKVILAYAGAIYELARFAEREGLKVEPQAAVMTTAEMLYPCMRERIEKVFQTTVYNKYGSREVGDIACERPGYCGLWVAPWGNYVEILDSEGRRVPDGDEGEIAVTSLTNYAMPLLRYRIGDRGVLAPRQSASRPRCGQVLQEVLGRSVDMIRGKNGKVIHGTYFTVILFFRDWIRKYQVVQKSLSRVVFRIVSAEPEHSQAELDEIVAKTRLALGDDCEVSFEFLDDIPACGSGKFRYIISEVQA